MKLTKKILVMASVSFILILMLNTTVIASKNPHLPETIVQFASSNNQTIINEPDEQLYYNLFITMLFPYVEKSIGNYYDEYMTYLPGEAPYSYKFIKIEKAPDKNYSFTIVLEIQPYVGPHLSVGRDRITFNIDLNGVRVEKFEHIESYSLPPNYQSILKKKLP